MAGVSDCAAGGGDTGAAEASAPKMPGRDSKKQKKSAAAAAAAAASHALAEISLFVFSHVLPPGEVGGRGAGEAACGGGVKWAAAT